MRERRAIVLSVIAVSLFCATIAGILPVFSQLMAAQNATVSAGRLHDRGRIYFPYPPGVIPSDLDSEVQRVRHEIDFIENEALGQLHALPSPTLAGNPQTAQGSGARAMLILGKLELFDETLSVDRNMACSFCHMPYVGFSGPIPSVNLGPVAYPGSVQYRFGKRKPQEYSYSPFFPVLHHNQAQGAFFGGNFWDSRATGYRLQSADAEQAQRPDVDPDEMGFPDVACTVFRLSQSRYRALFEQVWGNGSFDIKWPHNTEEICETPRGAAVLGSSNTPVALSSEDRARANWAFDHFAQAITAYEGSPDISAFSSKFDAFLAGNYKFTPDETAGYKLFDGKANCNSCHLDGRGTTLTAAQKPDKSAAASTAPLFTCFGSANLGLPRNPSDAYYYETKPDSFKFTPNPSGFHFLDLGLGLFLKSLSGNNPDSDWIQFAPTSNGQMQTATARNAAMTPPGCTTEPGQGKLFQKAFFHNGYIKSLKELVHFYNTRDKYAYAVQSGHCPAGTTEKVDCWPQPEVPQNVDRTFGNLGLTDKEETQIVVFLQTLTDGYTRPYPDINTFTGTCK
jgi:cytochrome c peroxidase